MFLNDADLLRLCYNLKLLLIIAMYGSFMNDTINTLICYFYWLNDEDGYVFAAFAEPETDLKTHDDIIIEQFQFIYFRKKI